MTTRNRLSRQQDLYKVPHSDLELHIFVRTFLDLFEEKAILGVVGL